MRKIFVFVPIFLAFTVLFCAVTPTVTMSENISEKVFRLHILANSDSREDQQLKLKVKDEIVELSKGVFADCNNIDSAIETADNNLELFTMAAQNVVAENGYNYPVSVTVDKEYFKTRYYDSFTLPAGVYDCLKIELGEGKGHNWWCVLFPAVCLSGCTDDFDGFLTEDEKELLTNDYVVRFKTVEIYEDIKQRITQK